MLLVLATTKLVLLQAVDHSTLTCQRDRLLLLYRHQLRRLCHSGVRLSRLWNEFLSGLVPLVLRHCLGLFLGRPYFASPLNGVRQCVVLDQYRIEAFQPWIQHPLPELSQDQNYDRRLSCQLCQLQYLAHFDIDHVDYASVLAFEWPYINISEPYWATRPAVAALPAPMAVFRPWW